MGENSHFTEGAEIKDIRLDLQVLGIPHDGDGGDDYDYDRRDATEQAREVVGGGGDDDDKENPVVGKMFKEIYQEKGLFGSIWHYVWGFVKRFWGSLLFVILISIGLTFLGIFVFDPLPAKAWVAFAIVLITLGFLVASVLRTSATMFLAVTAMLLAQIITPKDALGGFANEAVATVAVLFVVVEGIQQTSVLRPIYRVLLGKPKRLIIAQLRLILPVAASSAFLNNTPIVAMMIPVVQNWSRRAGFPVSKLLLPLSYSSILGGTVTLIGTSTNLVVVGLVQDAKIKGQNGELLHFPFFGISPMGIAYCAIGLTYILLATPFLLKDRGTTGIGAMIENPREYTVALQVEPKSSIVGDTVQEAGLRRLPGLFLMEITRSDGVVIPAVPPETRLQDNDILLFTGNVETVKDVYLIPGLKPATNQSLKMKVARHRRRLVELVVAPSSNLVGKTPKECDFRSQFDAAIIAVHRHGEHIKQRIGDIVLHGGDTLLVETGAYFIERFGRNYNFALVSEVSGSQPTREDRPHMILVAGLAIVMIALVTAGKTDFVTAGATVVIIMVLTGCMTVRQAVKAVDMEVILTIVASFGVAKGLEVTGGAEQLAKAIVDAFRRLGSIGLLFGIYISTAILTELITNNSAVSLMFPVVNAILKKETSLNPFAAFYCLMLAASASFSTPIGYQCNMMVHGPGGYKFTDWAKIGVPLQVILAIAGVLLAHLIYR